MLVPAGRGYSLTPNPLLWSASVLHQRAHYEPGIREIRAQLTHELENARILSVADDWYRGFKRMIWNEGGSPERGRIALCQEGCTPCRSWTFSPSQSAHSFNR